MKKEFRKRPIGQSAASGFMPDGGLNNENAENLNVADWSRTLIRMLERAGYRNLALAILLCVKDQNRTQKRQVELNEFVELALRLLENGHST